ncbi:ice-binding family protein [Dyadobacter sp. CY356]|uniref:ice-binding family protein n=1 Tax=Dyadobacter sp. CY356 TaxID=2906442 RepID=UPI001F20AC6F|nr:ice-binding family protein [Dyadobacter sp. CY356]MCF0056412.1 ice-binding family protein [Dyadobacter sp. CY356]
MTKTTTLLRCAALILCMAGKISAQAPAIPVASEFGVFTGSGAITNSGATTVKGALGTRTGSITGSAISYSGQSHINDQTSINAETEITNVLASFSASGGTCQTLGATFGNGATLTAGNYCLGTAGVLTGDLTLDGGGDASSIFVFNIGGELTATDANIILTGSATWNNVYFIVNGAFNLNQNTSPATSIFRGTAITSGVISLSSGSRVQGRLLSGAGAINLQGNTIYAAETPLPVTLTSFTAKKGELQTTLLKWTTTAETNSDRFEIQRSNNGKVWNPITTILAKGESTSLSSYQYSDTKPENGTNLYRLKMIDKDETFAYSRIESTEFKMLAKTVLYPNPAVDYLTLNVDDISMIQRIQISNILGVNVYDITKAASDLSSKVDVKNLPSGMYIVRITNNTGNIASAKIVKQ